MGVGLTVKVNGIALPWHEILLLVNTGVTEIFAVAAAALLAFTAVNMLILPVPLEAKPMEVLSLVQMYEVALPAKLMSDVDVLLQTTWFATAFTAGVGLTVMVYVAF